MNDPLFNSDILFELIKTRMPFGKYKDRRICDLPEDYILFFQKKGFPKGKIGMLLQTMYEINLNGLRGLLDPLKKM